MERSTSIRGTLRASDPNVAKMIRERIASLVVTRDELDGRLQDTRQQIDQAEMELKEFWTDQGEKKRGIMRDDVLKVVSTRRKYVSRDGWVDKPSSFYIRVCSIGDPEDGRWSDLKEGHAYASGVRVVEEKGVWRDSKASKASKQSGSAGLIPSTGWSNRPGYQVTLVGKLTQCEWKERPGQNWRLGGHKKLLLSGSIVERLNKRIV